MYYFTLNTGNSVSIGVLLKARVIDIQGFMPKKLGSVHITLHVMPELRQRFKLACTSKNKNMTEVLEAFMDEYASEYEKSLKLKTED